MSFVFLIHPQQVFAVNNHFLIDFGSAFFPTNTSGWNNILETSAGDSTTQFPLVDSDGSATSVTIQMTDPFQTVAACNSNTAGTTSSTVYEASATRDSFYLGNNCAVNDTTATLVLSGLDDDFTYDLRFYASRVAGDAGNRTANYTVGATTVSLNATDNVNTTVEITDVVPSSGTITLAMTKASGANFSYLGVWEITGTAVIPDNVDPVAQAGSNQAITLPTNTVTLSGSATDDDGTISSYAWTEVTSGATIASPNSATTEVSDLSVGTHTFRLTVTDNSGGIDTDDVDVVVSEEDVGVCSAKKIAVVGSSTAAGTGADPSSNSWVNRYVSYLQQINPANSIVNLGFSGLNTYQALPTGTTPPGGRPSPDPVHNITAALATTPDGIIINLPTNDAGLGYSLSETQANFQTMYTTAYDAEVPVWFTTSQPRDLDSTGRANLISLRDWVISTYTPYFLNFWNVIAESDGTINSTYAYGDGIHLNNLGHGKLYSRASSSNILATLCDETDPVLSTISAAPATTTSTITWTSSEPASSWVEYGTDTSYGLTTTETNTLSRVTSHSVELTTLNTCTTYHYRVHSHDANFNEGVSSDNTFTTSGCPTASPSSSSNQTPAATFGPSYPPRCEASVPVGLVDLFQINRTPTAVKLYFTPVGDHVKHYHVVYGFQKDQERFGALSSLVNEEYNDGVQSLEIKHLNPRQSYWFRIVPVNDCAVGTWSNWLEAKPPKNPLTIFYRYFRK